MLMRSSDSSPCCFNVASTSRSRSCMKNMVGSKPRIAASVRRAAYTARIRSSSSVVDAIGPRSENCAQLRQVTIGEADVPGRCIQHVDSVSDAWTPGHVRDSRAAPTPAADAGTLHPEQNATRRSPAESSQARQQHLVASPRDCGRQ